MGEAKNLDEIYNLKQSDIRLEVILADLVNEDLGLNELIVLNNGQFQRNYHKDIEQIEHKEYGKFGRSKLTFTVNRNGLYDNLPEDIFHQPSDTRNYSDASQIISEMKIQEGLEKSARSFFVPYEQEFYRLRIKLEMEERKFLFETNSSLSDLLFSDLWNFPDYLDRVQKSKLGVLMTVINRLSGNTALVAAVIRNITGDDVEIIETPPLHFEIPENFILGAAKLDEDSIFGGDITDNQRSITLRITLGNPLNLMEYMPGGNKNRIYSFLCNLLIPLENDVLYEMHFQNESAFHLDDEKVYAGRLSYTTII
jgi:hypothetical protein